MVITTFDLDEYVFEALRIGASGFACSRTSRRSTCSPRSDDVAGDALFRPPDHEARDRAVRAAPQPTRPQALDELTGREREIFLLIANGPRNAEIGQKLYISETTVKTHVTHLFQKLDVRDRVQAVVLAYQAGLVEPAP